MGEGSVNAEPSERLQFRAAAGELLPTARPLPTAVSGRHGDAAVPERTEGGPSSARSVAPSGPSRLRAVPGLLRCAVEAELERGAAFNFVPVLLATGALGYFALPSEPGFGPIAATAAVLALLAVLARARIAMQLALSAALCVALGMVFAKVETWRAGTKVIGSEISTRLTGRVVSIEHMANGRVRFTLDMMATERPTLRYAPGRVRVSARSAPEGTQAGDVLKGAVRLMPPSGPVRPNGYDFAFEAYFDGLGANGFFLGNPERVAEAGPMEPLDAALAWIENARTKLAARIRSHISGDAEGEIAAALVAGVRAGIPEEVNEALRKTGLAHVLSISGLHMALVALVIMGTIRFGAALFPDFASRHAVRKYAATVALAALAIYLLISGSAVAAERSFIMIAVMLAALLIDRAALTMRNLAISAIIILVLSPHEAAGPSFQMSFAATVALIAAYAGWSRWRERRTAKPPASRGRIANALGSGTRYFGALAATSVVAGAATALYGVYHFQRVATLGLAANLAAMPVVSVVVMPMAVFGVVLMPFGLDGPAYWLMGEGLSWMIAITEWFAARSPLDGVGMIPPSAVVVLTLALVTATLLTTWLRALAVPVALLGLIMIAARPMPDILVSEDGRLVGLALGDSLAVNRARPNGFTTENWLMAMNRETLAKPTAGDPESLHSPSETGFFCAEGICTASTEEGVIVHAETAELAWPYCKQAALIVIDDATASDQTCATDAATVLTKRMLAVRGSAAITLSIAEPASVEFALSGYDRPWHAHRAFSREARAMPPWRPATSRAQTSTDGLTGQQPASVQPPFGRTDQ